MAERSSCMKQRLSFGPLSLGYLNDVDGEKDVTFIVENKRFRAHVNILCKVTPVFQQMLRGPFKKEREIVLENIRASAFTLFLKLIYDGTRSVSPILTPEDSLNCLLIANRFLIPDLEKFLRTKLLRNLTYKNVFQVLPFCNLTLNIWSIRSACWSVIERDTAKVLKTDQFPKISWDLLCDILENGHLTVNEFEIFAATRRWVQYQAKLEKPKTPAEVYNILGVAIYKIRFPLMTVGEFKLVKMSGFLKKGEVQDLEANFRKNTTFPNQPRRNLCLCRKKGLNCRMCRTSTKTSIDGTRKGTASSGRKRPPALLQPHYSSINTIFTDDVSSRRERVSHTTGMPEIERHRGNTLKATPATDSVAIEVTPPECECYKYKSCPAFPNGTTVEILRKEGFHCM